MYAFSFLILILSIYSIPAQSVDNEMQRLTHYAEEYETGNINYPQLLVHLANVRESLNEIVGVVSREEGGILKTEQIESILGPPKDFSKWVWVEDQGHDGGHEKRLDEPVPEWRKIVFDGRKIQIRIEAYPSIIERIDNDELVYRLNFNIEFKRPESQIDVESKIIEITNLAETFSADPSRANAETLAKASVNAERAFEQSFNQGSQNCEALMNDIFGSENKRGTQNTIVQEIDFFEGENFDAVMRLEMCDDCSDWFWINLDMWIEDRGQNFDYGNDEDFEIDWERKSKGKSFGKFEEETRELIDEIKSALAVSDFHSSRRNINALRELTNDWNEEANDVWEEIDQLYSGERTFSSEEEEREYYDNYGWIKEEQERMQKVRDKTKSNYELRKIFYSDLFSDYDKTESNFVENNWEKRLVEEFKEFGEEICNNNLDDNNNGEIDCSDSQCGGKICGKLIDTIEIDNATSFEETILYCIAGTCQAKEEITIDEGPICGNNICEAGERDFVSLQFTEDDNSDEDSDEDETVDGEEEVAFPPECGAVDCLQGFHCVIGGFCVADDDKEDSVKLCHIPPGNPNSAHTIEVGALAVEDHISHGDYLGECVEEGKSLFCPQDCVQCPVYDAIECSGDVIFSGEDKNGCPLEPICLEEEKSCEADSDCKNPLCGISACIEESCKVVELTECREQECLDGEERIQHCESGEEIVVEKCIESLWESTRLECRTSEGESCNQYCWDQVAVMSFSCPGHLEISGGLGNCACDWICDEVVGEECTVKSDCGNDNDVCSNGKCVTIPESIDNEDDFDEESDLSPEKSEEGEPEETEEIAEEPSEEPEEESVEELPEESSEPEVTGNFVFTFFAGLLDRFTITGGVVNDNLDFVPLQDDSSDDSGSSDDNSGDSGGNDAPGDSGSDDTDNSGDIEGDVPAENGGEGSDDTTGEDIINEEDEFEDNFEDNFEDDFGHEEDDYQDDFRDDYEEDYDYKEDLENDCKFQCENFCYNQDVRPCTEDCIWEECGYELKCNVDEVTNSCETKCEKEIDIDSCETDCNDKCLSGEDIWKDFEDNFEEHKEEKGVFNVGGSCRTVQGRTEGFIWFGGWGDPFDEIERLKNKYYSGGEADWCKDDFENLKRQRREFEKGFDEEFVRWFFESYLTNSAEDWQKHLSGIFDLYWSDIRISEDIVSRMQCLNLKEFPEHELIRVEYKTDYGEIEFWEELEVKRLYDNEEETEIISPFMKLWIFPSRDFFKIEMQRAMERGEMPGPSEDSGRSRNTPSEKEKRRLIEDGILEDIREFNDKYGEHVVVQFIDFETNEVAFNIYTRVNEEEIIYFEPMLPSDNPAEDVRIELDVEKMLDIVEFMESGHVELESPPWSPKRRIGTVEGFTDGVQIFFKFRSLMNSARVFPESAEPAGKFFMRDFFSIIMGDEGDDRGRGGDRGGDGDDFEGDFSKGREGPGGCQDEEECREYCEENPRECEQFGGGNEGRDLPEGWEPKGVITGEVVRR